MKKWEDGEQDSGLPWVHVPLKGGIFGFTMFLIKKRHSPLQVKGAVLSTVMSYIMSVYLRIRQAMRFKF